MTLFETVVTIGIISIVTISGGGIALHARKPRMDAAAMHLFGMMNRSRATAMTTCRYAGIYIDRDRKKHQTTFWRVVDGNGNGIRTKDIKAGIDRKLGKGFCLETDYKGVLLNKVTVGGGSIISFSPNFKSSTGSVIFGTEDEMEGRVRVKLYGLSTLMRPVRIFPDGHEQTL